MYKNFFGILSAFRIVGVNTYPFGKFNEKTTVIEMALSTKAVPVML